MRIARCAIVCTRWVLCVRGFACRLCCVATHADKSDRPPTSAAIRVSADPLLSQKLEAKQSLGRSEELMRGRRLAVLRVFVLLFAVRVSLARLVRKGSERIDGFNRKGTERRGARARMAGRGLAGRWGIWRVRRLRKGAQACAQMLSPPLFLCRAQAVAAVATGAVAVIVYCVPELPGAIRDTTWSRSAKKIHDESNRLLCFPRSLLSLCWLSTSPLPVVLAHHTPHPHLYPPTHPLPAGTMLALPLAPGTSPGDVLADFVSGTAFNRVFEARAAFGFPLGAHAVPTPDRIAARTIESEQGFPLSPLFVLT